MDERHITSSGPTASRGQELITKAAEPSTLVSKLFCRDERRARGPGLVVEEACLSVEMLLPHYTPENT
ncbi:unnamed protein product [Diplocarpon coronariae]